MKINLRLVCGATALVLAIATAAFAETDAQLMKEAKITKKQAEQTALAKAPNGKLIWSFDIAKTSTKNITEVQVDAITGAVYSVKVETPKDQKAEAAADRASKK